MCTIETADPILQDFLQRIGGVRPQIRRLILFGSRARGDHRLDSDYDILVLVTCKDPALLDSLYDAVMDVLLDHGRLVSLKIFSESEFSRLLELKTPFTTRIAEEGRVLG